MRSVLFGMSRRDAFRNNAQADPPDRQRREAAQAGTGKGAAVVAANSVWQPVLGERARKSPLGLVDGAAQQPVAAEHEATEPISQRQRIAIHAIARSEFAFEV